MLQSIIINQMDNGSNRVSRLGLEGVSNCSKVLFEVCDQKHSSIKVLDQCIHRENGVKGSGKS
jgi:hypothetical protein